MSESVKITIEAEDKASAALVATAKIYKDNIARSIQLNNAAMTAEERHASAVRQFQTDLVKGIITRETYNRLIQKSIVENKIETDSVRTMRLEVEKLVRTENLLNEAKRRSSAGGSSVSGGGGIGGIGGGMAATAAIALAVSGVKASVGLAAGIESATIAFEVLTGSAEKAATIIQEMKAMDTKSPLSFGDIQLAGKTLLGYGVAAEKVMPALTALGDISMGNGDKFKSLALAFGQVQASGRLMGQEVLQMVNQGFNPLQEISKNTGKSMIVLKKEMEDGKISAKMVTAALISATSQGGRFFGMTERISNSTASGAFAKTANEVQKLGIAYGNAFIPAAKFGAVVTSMAAKAAAMPANAWNSFTDNFKKVTAATDALEASWKKLDQTVTESHKKIAKIKVDPDAYKLKAFATEREDFNSRLKNIDEEYQKKMMGEEKYNAMKLQTSLQTSHMVNGDAARLQDAQRKQEFIKIIEANEIKKKELEKNQEQATKQAEDDAKRVQQIKQNELDKLREEQILLTRGKEAAHAFNLEKQGLSRPDAQNIARQQANLDRMKDFGKDKEISRSNVATTLQAFESRLLTRGGDETPQRMTEKNTAASAASLKTIEKMQAENNRLQNQFVNVRIVK